MTSLLDIVKESDLRLGITNAFKSRPRTRVSIPSLLGGTLVACVN